MHNYLIASLLISAALFSPVYAQSGLAEDKYPVYTSPDTIPAEIIAEGRRIYGIQISPNGRYAVAFYPLGNLFQLRLLSIDEDESHDVNRIRIQPGDLKRVAWLDNNLVIVEQRHDYFNWETGLPETAHSITGFSREASMVKVPSMANEVIEISHLKPESNALNTIVHTLPDKEGEFLLSYSPDGKSYPGVYRKNIYSGISDVVVPSTPPIQGWLADADGVVRFGWGWAKGKLKMIVRPGNAETWETLKNEELVSSGAVEPILIESGGRTMIVKSALNQGRYGLYRVSLETGKMVEKIFEHSVVDVNSITYSSSDQKLLSAEFITDRIVNHYFDEELGLLMGAIEKALPDRSIQILQSSIDDRFLLIFVSSEIYPGAYYRFDRKTRELLLLDEVSSNINPDEMSRTFRKTYFSRDGLEIDGYLTIPAGSNGNNIPTVILPHSNPVERDYMKFVYFVQFLASRGFAVFQPNYRGSSGYGYAFSSLSINGWGMEMQDDLTDAATYLIDEGISQIGKICIVGRNYAGYAALLAVIRDSDIFTCAVAISPVTDLLQWVKINRRAFGNVAAAAIAGKRSKKQLKQSSPLHLVDNLVRPVLIVHGSNDTVIPFDQSLEFFKTAEDKGKNISSLGLAGGDNNISNLRDRILILYQMNNFLKKSMQLEKIESKGVIAH